MVWSIPTNSEEKRSSHWNTQESCWTWQGGVSRTRGQSRNEGVYHPKMRWQGKSSPRGEWIFGLLKLFQEDGFILRGAGIEDNDVCMGKWSWSTVWRRRLEGRSLLRFLQYVLVKPKVTLPSTSILLKRPNSEFGFTASLQFTLLQTAENEGVFFQSLEV